MLSRRFFSSLRSARAICRVFPSSSSFRSFGSIPVPIAAHGRDADNIYRRPETPVPTAPLSEDDELMWDDAQAPEPALDAYENIDEYSALKQLLGALLTVTTLAYGTFTIFDPSENNPAIRQEYPFDNLRKELGGSANRRNKQSNQPQV
jgi:hypothetical protein